MSSASERAGLVAAAVLLLAGGAVGMSQLRDHLPGRVTALRVCADPNNMPFSDSAQHGFENRIASLIAADLHVPLEYDWRPQRRGWVRNTLKQGTCDVVMGVPRAYGMIMPTASYYQSTYVFVTRADRHLGITSFDDVKLRHLKIGVHLMGDDYANSPAAVALGRRGLRGNLVGYMIYGDYSSDSPPSRLLDAVAQGAIDVAVVWGPLAGYYAKHSRVPLTVTPVSPSIDVPFMPFVYEISMGVRHGDSTRRAVLDSEIVRRQADIDTILDRYGIPRVGARPAGAPGADGGGGH
jgi:mxaJ protein